MHPHHDGEDLAVVVRDFSAGFDEERIAPGSGLGGTRERAELLEGPLKIDAAPGKEVTVAADLPLGGD